jgi:acetoin utilization deacetylase AcuC-like enzyme
LCSPRPSHTGRSGDLLADFRLSDADFASLTREVIAIADRHCQGRVVSALEGGYALLDASQASDT